MTLLLVGSLRRVGHTVEVGVRHSQEQVPSWISKYPFGAITLGHVIIGQSHELLTVLRPHEQVHVRQCEAFGPFFLVAYPLASLWALFQGRKPYEENAFELQAVQKSGFTEKMSEIT
ncbi:MAG: hypothetical protein HGA37_14300 [Lentimicrobium sp.]|nr:hypothetical protein [Lentimicrobium sp.]